MIKKYLCILLLSFLISNNIKSQSCVNGTETNPAYPSPNVNNYKKNTFDWTSRSTYPPNNLIPYAVSNYPSAGVTVNTIVNPFWSTSQFIDRIAGGADSDNKPEDGWELIKQDFGYYYDNVTQKWNGNTMGTGQPSDPRAFPSSFNYMMLYNKYTGILRIMAKLPLVQNSLTNRIYFKLSFLQDNSKLNYQNLKVNGLFNTYNTMEHALDKQTIVTEVSAPAFITNSSSPDFTYCDIQLSYDPCVCFFESAFLLEFYNLITGNISLKGRYAGASGINVMNVASNNTNGYVAGQNNGDNFIASIFDNGNSPETVIQHYQSLLAYQTYANGLNGNNDLQFFKDNLGYAATALDIAEAVVPYLGLATTALETTNLYLSKSKKGLDFLSQAVEKITAKTDDNSGANPQSPITVSTGYLQATGTLQYNFIVPGYEAKTSIPGSLNSISKPEYGSANLNGRLPDYPEYNEPTGLFTLLKTPIVEYYKDVNFWDIYNPNPSLQNNWTYFDYRAKNDIQYMLNPIVNQNKSKVYIRYEIEGMPIEPTPTQDNPQVYSDYTHYGATVSGNNDYGPINSNSDPSCNSNNIPFTYNYNKLLTPLYDVGCNSKIYVKEKYKVQQLPIPGCHNTQLNRPRKIKLVVLLDLFFNLDVYGKEHHSIKIVKYDCDLIFGGNFNLQDPNTNVGEIMKPDFLTLSIKNYTAPEEIFAFKEVVISGSQNTSGNFIQIVAGKEIGVNSESSLNTELQLKIQDLPNFYNSCNMPINSTVFSGSLNNYCTNSGVYSSNTGYKANQRLTATANPTNNSSPEGAVNSAALAKQTFKSLTQDYKIGIYPNPTTGNLTVNFFSGAVNNVIISLEDVTGKQLLSQATQTEQGYSSNQLNLQEFANGIYLLKITNNKGQLIKTEKVILNR